MDILKINWDSPLEYAISLFNTSFNTYITFLKITNHIQYLQKKLRNNTNGHVNEILYNPFISVPLIKVFKNPKI
jgi:hypothetical protein